MLYRRPTPEAKAEHAGFNDKRAAGRSPVGRNPFGRDGWRCPSSASSGGACDVRLSAQLGDAVHLVWRGEA